LLGETDRALDSYTFQSENFPLRFKKYPLPWREGIKGRGMHSGFTPTLTLPHQRGGFKRKISNIFG